MQHKEHDEQAAVVKWARRNIGRWPCLKWLHSNGNGAQYGANRRMAIIQSQKQKSAGQVNGIADLFLPFSAKGYHGLYLEMKRPGALNEVKPRQKEFLAYCESAGYLAQVFDNAEDAIAAIEDYLG